MMDVRRFLKHFWMGRSAIKRCLPDNALDNIERAIKAGEQTHTGQICFAVEASLDWPDLRTGKTPRQRAIEVFSQLRVWDTAHNNGVLIYLLLADHDVEIVVDRGVHAKVGSHIWEQVCREMEAAFRKGKFEEGVIWGIGQVSQHLAEHYPGSGEKVNELPDRPVVI